MSARQRAEAHRKAIRKGNEAFWKGESLDNNPYKISVWGVGRAWEMGWLDAKSEKEKGIRHTIFK